MAFSYNNTVASQALRGQSVKVTLSLGDFEEFISNPDSVIGAIVSCSGGSVLGTIGSIDTFGNSFEVVPIQPNLSFSDTPGYLSEGETVESYNP